MFVQVLKEFLGRKVGEPIDVSETDALVAQQIAHPVTGNLITPAIQKAMEQAFAGFQQNLDAVVSADSVDGKSPPTTAVNGRRRVGVKGFEPSASWSRKPDGHRGAHAEKPDNYQLSWWFQSTFEPFGHYARTGEFLRMFANNLGSDLGSRLAALIAGRRRQLATTGHAMAWTTVAGVRMTQGSARADVKCRPSDPPGKNRAAPHAFQFTQGSDGQGSDSIRLAWPLAPG